MAIDHDAIDDAVLALFQLTLHDDGRAWKGFDWNTFGRLHARGMIGNAAGRTRSVVLTEAGAALSAALFEALFAKKP